MKIDVKKHGNSLVILIPDYYVKMYKIKEGDTMEVRICHPARKLKHEKK